MGFIPPVFSVVLVASVGILAVVILGRAFAPAPAEGFIARVPNVDWQGLDESGRDRATRIMNENGCPCGCRMTVARCRRDDPTCPRSPHIASRIVAEVAAGKADAEVIQLAFDESTMTETGAAQDEDQEVDPSTTLRVRLETGDAPSVGPEGAPITLVEFIDYQCPFCARARLTVDLLREKYGDRLRVVFMQIPLDTHPDALLAAKAAIAAFEQGKFYEMNELMLENQDLLLRHDLVGYAGHLGLDVGAFEAALDSEMVDFRLRAQRARAERIGVDSTPYFFINGRPVRGAQPFEVFETIIEEELAGTAKPTRWVERAP